MSEEEFVLVVDQGTTLGHAIIFNHSGEIVAVGQKEFTQISPNPSWVEHDPVEIQESVRAVIASALQKAEISTSHLVAVGITNQRETTVVQDKNTGEPAYNTFTWQDVHTGDITRKIATDDSLDTERYRQVTGENIPACPSATKVKWISDNVEDAHERAKAGDLLSGTPDTWVLWNLTGGVSGDVHATDVTNTPRTLLMDVRELKWREDTCKDFGIPISTLPEIKPSVAIYGKGRSNGFLIGVPISGILGDQQATTSGQAYFEPGATKNTYNTGCFTLMSTSTEPVFSKDGLLTTVLYQLGGEAPVYALEGSVAIASSLVQQLHDNLGMTVESSDVGVLVESVKDNGDIYFVPAFSGLFTPYWCGNAHGAIVGLTHHVDENHITRAVEELAAFQSTELIETMNVDAGVPLKKLKVNGGVTHDELLMQFQADVSSCDVARPVVAEATILGVTYATGIAVGFWSSTEGVATNWQGDKRWSPSMNKAGRDHTYRPRRKAVARTFDWVDEDVR